METFEWIIIMFLAAALLASLARRFGVPYPTFLAIGGVCFAFIPNSPEWTLDPHLALTLFVAPILVDAAYDTSLRDLRDNWRPVAGLVVAAVGTTTVAVALAAHFMRPDMSWAVAIALGAIVAPPDAAAATAVMRQVNLPHRLLKILEGESLLNDASALLLYKLAILAVTAGSFSLVNSAPIALLTIVGSVVAGHVTARLFSKFIRFRDVPTAIIVQFAITFAVWIAAEEIGLSGILTIVVYAMTIANMRGPSTPARMRVPSFAIWETVVFILNAFAFVLIGLQLRPIWTHLTPELRFDYVLFALTILVVVIAARFAWVMSYNKVIRWRIEKRGFNPPRPMSRPTRASGLIISWAGMRGIVTLAAAFAIPETLADGSPFPYRDLILFTAFTVVFGTLVIQGLTLKPLIRWMQLSDDDPVAREVRQARAEAYRAALASIEGEESIHAVVMRKEYRAVIEVSEKVELQSETLDLPGSALRRFAIAAARARALELRRTLVIGDDAYRLLEEELDWAELSAGGARVAE